MKDIIRDQENILRPISGALHYSVGTQRQELTSLRAQMPNPDSTNLFEWYRKDAKFRETYHKAMNYALISGLKWAGSRNLESNFAGITFENIAFVVCALKENSSGIVVLSSTRTSELFKYLYPNAHRVNFSFREDSLGGNLSIPDGIGIDASDLTGNTILNIYEYTLSQKKVVFDEKYDSFQKKKRNFPELFGAANLVFVVPKSAILPNVNASDIRFIQTNFTRSDFREFIVDVYCNYTVSDDVATLEEIEGWTKVPRSGKLQKSKVDRTSRRFLSGIK